MELSYRIKKILGMAIFYTYAEVGAKFGVSKQYVGYIVKNMMPYYVQMLSGEIPKRSRYK